MPEFLQPYVPFVIGMVILFVVATIGKMVLEILSGKPRRETSTFPYQRIETLFTPAERSFLGVLDQVLGSEFRVFGKVRVADVLQVTKQPNRSDWQKAFNRISAKHFDFVICRSTDLAILMAIELDDKSHQKESAKRSDAFLDQAAQAAGLPLVRFPCQQSYSIEAVTATLTPYFEGAQETA